MSIKVILAQNPEAQSVSVEELDAIEPENVLALSITEQEREDFTRFVSELYQKYRHGRYKPALTLRGDSAQIVSMILPAIIEMQNDFRKREVFTKSLHKMSNEFPSAD